MDTLLFKLKQLTPKYLTLLFLGVYSLTRVSSFLLAPHPIAQGFLVIILLGIFLWLAHKNPKYGWYFFLIELFLNGSGRTFELGGIALRTWLLVGMLAIYGVTHIRTSIPLVKKNLRKKHVLVGILFASTIVVSTALGLFYHHNPKAVLGDLLPYFFFLLAFPGFTYVQDWHKNPFVIALLKAFVLGTTLFSLFTEYLFSFGVATIQGPYYKWFRDFMGGKITDMGEHFFRVVIPEHLALVPVVIFFAAFLIAKNEKKTQKKYWLFLGITLITLALNLSRTYMLGISAGLAALFFFFPWQRWLRVGSTLILVWFILFTLLHGIASRGQSLGWNLIGLRLASFARPQIEESTITRMTLLAPMTQAIRQQPLLGSGLGAMVSVIDPRTKTILRTPHLDWGYLELLLEIGIIGTIAYAGWIMTTIAHLWYHLKQKKYAKEILAACVGALASLLVMEITAPAFTHIYGILCLTAFFLLIKSVSVE